MVSPSPLRLLHITTVPLTLRFLSWQVSAARAQGIEVHALSSPGPDLWAFGREHAVPAHGVAMSRSITPLRDLCALHGVWRALRHVRPHIVHAHTPKGGLLGMLAARLAGVPVCLYHLHGLPLLTAGAAKTALLERTERLCCNLAHHVLCVSGSLRELAVARGLCRADKISVLANGSIGGVDARERFNPSTDPAARSRVRSALGIPTEARVAGFVGRLVPDKGLVELAQAWRHLREELPDLHLLVVGPFEDHLPLPGDVARLLRSDPRVHLVGLDLDTPPLYAAMDVVVLPTYREGFPVVPLEAAAMAVPVVASRVPGCVDAVVDEVTGALVPPRDVRALAAAVRGYVLDRKRARAHGEAARRRVLQDFQPQQVWEETLAEYHRLLRAQR